MHPYSEDFSMKNTDEGPNLLSVVVPVRNMAGRLNLFSSWLLKEVTTNVQVIVVYDYSDDDTATELKLILSNINLGNIHFIEGRFGNPGAARNAGLKIATADWITFWDSDDFPIVEEFLEMIQIASKQGAECAIGSFSVFRGPITSNHKKHIIETSSQSYFDEIAMNPGIWRWAFKRTILGESRFLPIRMGEDLSFLVELNVADRKLFASCKIVYNYQTGLEAQLTSQPKAIPDLLVSLEFLLKKFNVSTIPMERFVSILFCRQVLTLMRKGNFESKLRLLKFLAINSPDLLKNKSPIAAAMRFVLQNRKPLVN